MSDVQAAHPEWHAEVLRLLARADLQKTERAFLAKLAGWKKPGVDGAARLREIADRVRR